MAKAVEQTGKLHKCWDINGTDPDPTPPQIPDGTPAATTAELRSKIDSWEHRRNLAQEAIFKYLSSNDIAKIYEVKTRSSGDMKLFEGRIRISPSCRIRYS